MNVVSDGNVVNTVSDVCEGDERPTRKLLACVGRSAQHNSDIWPHHNTSHLSTTQTHASNLHENTVLTREGGFSQQTSDVGPRVFTTGTANEAHCPAP